LLVYLVVVKDLFRWETLPSRLRFLYMLWRFKRTPIFNPPRGIYPTTIMQINLG
jgi:hypothetical protein